MTTCSENQSCEPCGAAKAGKTWLIKQGALFSRLLKIRWKRTGASFNLTGYGVRAYLRRNLFDASEPPLATCTCTIVDAATGQARVRLGATVTRGLYDRGFFDVEVYSLDDPDEVYRVLQGAFTVDLEATTV